MRFIHVKTGEEVKFLRLGLNESTCKPVVVYETLRGDVWTRDAEEFFDGRFITTQEHEKLKAEAALAKANAIRTPSKRRD